MMAVKQNRESEIGNQRSEKGNLKSGIGNRKWDSFKLLANSSGLMGTYQLTTNCYWQKNDSTKNILHLCGGFLIWHVIKI